MNTIPGFLHSTYECLKEIHNFSRKFCFCQIFLERNFKSPKFKFYLQNSTPLDARTRLKVIDTRYHHLIKCFRLFSLHYSLYLLYVCFVTKIKEQEVNSMEDRHILPLLLVSRLFGGKYSIFRNTRHSSLSIGLAQEMFVSFFGDIL